MDYASHSPKGARKTSLPAVREVAKRVYVSKAILSDQEICVKGWLPERAQLKRAVADGELLLVEWNRPVKRAFVTGIRIAYGSAAMRKV